MLNPESSSRSVLRVLLKDTSKLLGATVVARLASLAFLYFAIRLFAPAELSIIPVFVILSTMSTLFTNFGLYPTLIREIPKLVITDLPSATGLMWTVLVLVMSGALVFSAFVWVFSEYLASILFKDPSFSNIIKLLVVGINFKALDEVFTFGLRATGKFSALALKRVFAEIAQPVLGMLLYLVAGAPGLVIGISLGMALGIVIGLWALRAVLFARFKFYPIGGLLRFSWPYYVEGYIYYLLQQGDQLTVAILLPVNTLAAYYVARRLYDLLTWVIQSVDETVSTNFAEGHSMGHPAFCVLVKRVSQGSFSLFVPMAFLSAGLAHVFIDFIAGGKYLEAITPTVLFVLVLLPYGMMTIWNGAILIVGRPKDRLFVTGSYAFALILGSIALARVGIVGVASARLLASLLAAGIAFFMLRRLGVTWQMRSEFAILVAGFVAGTLLVALQMLYYSVYIVPFYLVCAVGLYSIMMFRQVKSFIFEMMRP